MKNSQFSPEQLGGWYHLLKQGILGRHESKFHFEHVKFEHFGSTRICQIGNPEAINSGVLYI